MTTTVQSLPLQEVADKCHEHTLLFYQGKPYDPKWCYELLRRALKLEQDDAFEHVYRVYFSQVMNWIRHHPRFDAIHGPAEDFVQIVITKFWQNVRGEKFDNFPRLNSLLGYLKLCVHSTVMDNIDDSLPPIAIDPEKEYADGSLSPIGIRIHIMTILDCVEKALNDDVLMEQFELWIIYDLKPREIVKLFDDWNNPQEISRLRQRIKYRLENSKSLRTCLQGYLPVDYIN